MKGDKIDFWGGAFFQRRNEQTPYEIKFSGLIFFEGTQTSILVK